MKKPAYFLLSALLFPIVAFAESYTLEVNGMICTPCASRLEGELKAIEGVKSVSVELKTRQAIVDMIDGKNLQEDQVRKALTDSGFTLVKLTEVNEGRH